MTSVTLSQITTGGLDPDYFDLKEAWYPVYYVQDLDKTKPNAFTLLEENLVIWWDKESYDWKVFLDQCPHRLVPLSEGRINEEGLLECPYHGWSFSGEGKCQTIPQQVLGNNAETSPRACVKSYPNQVKQGLLFVYAGTPQFADNSPIPMVEPLEEDEKEWVCLNTFRDLPYDAFTLLENVLDVSHLCYTHHNTVGSRSNATPIDAEIIQSGRFGFQAVWKEGPRKGTLGPQNTNFVPPSLMYHDLTSEKLGRILTVVYATPIRKGECRFFARFPFKFTSKFPRFFLKLTPQWFSHVNQNVILEDDQIFLHYQERFLEAKGGSQAFAKACYLPTKADLYVLEFRNWINNYQVDGFPNSTFRTILARETLLDRYYSHTQHCASCRQALKTINLVQELTLIIAILCLFLAPILGSSSSLIAMIITASLGLLCAGITLALSKYKRKFYDGQIIPPRNK